MATMDRMAPNNAYLSNATGQIARQNGSGVYTRTVDPNETVAGQYTNLLKGPLAERAARKGATMAQMRGSSGNDTIFARASQDALAENLLPVANADAATFGRVGSENAEALNQQNVAEQGNKSNQIVANIGASASKEGARLNFLSNQNRMEEDRRQFDMNFKQNQANREQDRNWQLADAETARKANGRAAIMNQALGTIFSDPSYWRDPEGASGMVNFFSTQFSNIWDSLFQDRP